MTFYWWSHWFWITVLTIVTYKNLSVCSYPSQGTSTPSFLELNQHLSTPQNIVTKLIQQIEISTPNQEGTTKLHSILTESTTYKNSSSKLSLQDIDLSEEKDDIKRSIEDTTETRSKENATTEEQTSHIEADLAITTAINNYSSFEISTVDSSFNSTHIEKHENISVVDGSSEKRVEEIIPKSSRSKNNSLHLEPVEDETDSTASAASISVTIQRAPFTLENANKLEQIRQAESEHYARKSKLLAADYKVAHTFTFPQDSKNLLTRSASVAPIELSGPKRRVGDEGNISREALAIKRTYFLDAGTISAICLTIFGICCTIGTLGIVLYRRKYINKPQTLSEPDSSVYIDDSTMRVSDNSDEMYSLDNDSFLNSLEAMTIQNYWTDTVKHTKL